MKLEVCPMTGKECQYVSMERVIKIQRVGVIKTGRFERRETRIDLGEFCNNDGKHFVRDLKECPIPGALAVPLVPFVVDELTWMKRHSSGGG